MTPKQQLKDELVKLQKEEGTVKGRIRELEKKERDLVRKMVQIHNIMAVHASLTAATQAAGYGGSLESLLNMDVAYFCEHIAGPNGIRFIHYATDPDGRVRDDENTP